MNISRLRPRFNDSLISYKSRQYLLSPAYFFRFRRSEKNASPTEQTSGTTGHNIGGYAIYVKDKLIFFFLMKSEEIMAPSLPRQHKLDSKHTLV